MIVSTLFTITFEEFFLISSFWPLTEKGAPYHHFEWNSIVNNNLWYNFIQKCQKIIKNQTNFGYSIFLCCPRSFHPIAITLYRYKNRENLNCKNKPLNKKLQCLEWLDHVYGMVGLPLYGKLKWYYPSPFYELYKYPRCIIIISNICRGWFIP